MQSPTVMQEAREHIPITVLESKVHLRQLKPKKRVHTVFPKSRDPLLKNLILAPSSSPAVPWTRKFLLRNTNLLLFWFPKLYEDLFSGPVDLLHTIWSSPMAE